MLIKVYVWLQKAVCWLGKKWPLSWSDQVGWDGHGGDQAPPGIFYQSPYLPVAIIARNNLMLKLGVVILVASYHGRPEGVLWSVLRLKHQVRTRRGGSYLLHILLGLCWDCVGICWDRSQQSPSQTPTNHPSGFFGNILISVPNRKIWDHMIATIPKLISTEFHQQCGFL